MKRLYRCEKDAKIFGICAGIARYFEIDPTVVRIAAVILAIFGFVPFVLGYIVAYLLIPEYRDEESRARRLVRQEVKAQSAQSAQNAQSAQKTEKTNKTPRTRGKK